jgi:hypothetical protein
MAVKENSEYPYTTPTIVKESIERKPSDEEPIDITKSVAKEDKQLVKAAGVGAAVLGFVFGGPILSALLGFSAAYAVRKKNCTGNAARSLGELFISVQEKTAEIEEKNHFIEKTTTSINDFCDDEKEKSVAFKTRAFLGSTWLAASNYTKEKQLLERGVEETGKGLEFIAKTINKLQRKSTKHEEDLVFVSTDEVQDSQRSDFQYTKLEKVTTN